MLRREHRERVAAATVRHPMIARKVAARRKRK
jgi:hypothetical protein